ncbi:mevalonate kinase [Methanolapillus millepedarum]|uniref:Mevalonate kinase n=1 Tax=Methanolapillus millepedarum TaxID=3028296 RepID=A0AA96ZWJ5_9EURY|nr:Galactokinase [Methanosarcinaceae archaeon Ac7]
MITCSAPGKIFLFGEHAVVYGKTAIACAIDIRAHVTVEEVHVPAVQMKGPGGNVDLNQRKHPYIYAAVEKFRNLADLPPENPTSASGSGICIDIHSEIPVGSGLGSSSAVTIATLKSLDVFYGTHLSPDEIARFGHQVEEEVQGRASPTDTFVSTFGGLVRIPDRVKLDFFDAPIVIGNTRKFSSTRKLVSNVASLKERHPQVINQIMDTIGTIAETGVKYVTANDFTTVGELMNINQGLLDSIGVGSFELSELVYASRKAGALGSKITGAGGGGCMIALCEHKNLSRVAHSIKRAGGDSFICRTSNSGVRVEKEK